MSSGKGLFSLCTSHPFLISACYWGLAQNGTGWDPERSSGPETLLYHYPGDGGLLEAEAQSRWASSSMLLAAPLAHWGTGRDSDWVTGFLTDPTLFSWPYVFPYPKFRNWVRGQSENFGGQSKIILKGKHKNNSNKGKLGCFSLPQEPSQNVSVINGCGEGELTCALTEQQLWHFT